MKNITSVIGKAYFSTSKNLQYKVSVIFTLRWCQITLLWCYIDNFGYWSGSKTP